MDTTLVLIIILLALCAVQLVNFIAGGLAAEFGNNTVAAYEDVVDGQAAFVFIAAILTIVGAVVVIVFLKTEQSDMKKKIIIIILVVIAMFQFALAIMYAIVTTYNNELLGSEGSDQYENYYRSFYAGVFFSFILGVPLSLSALFIVLFDDHQSTTSNQDKPPGTSANMA